MFDPATQSLMESMRMLSPRKEREQNAVDYLVLAMSNEGTKRVSIDNNSSSSDHQRVLTLSQNETRAGEPRDALTPDEEAMRDWLVNSLEVS